MEFLEFTNILELDFNIINHTKDFVPGKCFKDYFPELDNVCLVINSSEATIDTIINEMDTVFFTINYQGKNGGKIFMLILLIVIIAIISYGTMTGPAAAAAAPVEGGAVGGGAGLGGDLLGNAIILPGEVATTTTASTGLSSSFMLQVGLMAGSMVLNALLAPKAPDQQDKPPEVSVYSWGDNKTQSKMMIPIPIILGKFPSFGNLIALKTDPKVNGSIYDSLIDIGSFQFGLCANELTEIEEIFINKLALKDMGKEEIVAFYTKGTSDQSFLYGIPGADQGYGTYRFILPNKPDYENKPLLDDEPLNPGQSVETVRNEVLPFPDHPIIGYKFPPGESIFELDLDIGGQGVIFWSEGNLTSTPGTVNLPRTIIVPYTLYVTSFDLKNLKMLPISDSSLLSYSVGDDILCSFNIGQGYFTWKYGWISTARTIRGVITEIIEYTLPPNYFNSTSNICYGYKIQVSEDYRQADVSPRSAGRMGKYNMRDEEGTPIEKDLRPDPKHVKIPDDNWVTYTTTDADSDSVEFELFLPGGLFYEYQDRVDDLDTYGAWVTFEWEVYYKEKIGDPYSESLILTTTDRPVWAGENDEDSLKFENRPVLGLFNYAKYPLKYVIPSFSIIMHPWSKPGPHGTHLNDPLKKGYYTYKLRISNYGNALFREIDGTYSSYGIVLPPEEQKHFSGAYEGHEAQVNQVVLYRIKEITYFGALTHPFTSVLGFTWVASQQYNNNLPQVQAICKNRILVWDETPGTEEDIVHHWFYAHSANPAYICINLLLNSYYGIAIAGYGSSSPQNSIEFQECITRFITKIDLDAFCAFAKYCDEPLDNIGSLTKVVVPVGVDPTDSDLYGKYINSAEWLYVSADRTYYPKRYTCNAVVSETKSIVDWLSQILGSYDAVITFQGSRISVKYDQQYNPFIPLQVFTSSNILKDSFKQTFLNPTLLASRIETTFMDEDNQYSKTPVILMPTEGTGLNPNRKTNVNVFGYTQIDRVLDRLHTILRKTNYLTQIIEFSTSTQGFTRRVADPIGVKHEFIEWGVTKDSLTENVLQASGRITKIAEENDGSGNKFNIYLDRPIHIEDEDVNLVNRYIYIRSLKDDDLSFKALITGYDLIFGNTRVTIPNIDPADDLYQIWLSLDKYDLFIIGEVDEVYKEAIITDIKFETDNIVTIKAVVYTDAIYQKETLITDIVGNLFTPEQCKVNNCQIFLENNNLSVVWEPPNLLSLSNSDTNKFDISLVEYKVYRMLQTPVEGSTSGLPLSSWEFVKAVQETSFLDTELEFGNNYGYKVTSVLSINNHIVMVPVSWNDECSRLLAYAQDYLDPVIPVDYGFSKVPSTTDDLFDFKIVANSTSQKSDWNNMLLVWMLVTSSTSTDWLGDQTIKLVKDVKVGDKYIYVDSINTLPRNSLDPSKVFGLVVINNLEIVWVEDSEEEYPGRYKLTLKYFTDKKKVENTFYTEKHKHIRRRYFLGSNQNAGSKVVNAHLGFYPVLLFANAEENNLISSPHTNTILLDSLYIYHFQSNTVKFIAPNDIKPLLADFVLNPDLYRTTATSKNTISQIKNAGVTDNGKISLTLKYMDITTFDLDISYSYRLMNGESHQIYVAALAPCPEFPHLTVVNQLTSDKIDFTFGNIKIPPGHHVYTALTHIYTIGERTETDVRGYTSFPVLLME